MILEGLDVQIGSAQAHVKKGPKWIQPPQQFFHTSRPVITEPIAAQVDYLERPVQQWGATRWAAHTDVLPGEIEIETKKVPLIVGEDCDL